MAPVGPPSKPISDTWTVIVLVSALSTLYLSHHSLLRRDDNNRVRARETNRFHITSMHGIRLYEKHWSHNLMNSVPAAKGILSSTQSIPHVRPTSTVH